MSCFLLSSLYTAPLWNYPNLSFSVGPLSCLLLNIALLTNGWSCLSRTASGSFRFPIGDYFLAFCRRSIEHLWVGSKCYAVMLVCTSGSDGGELAWAKT